MNVLNLLFAAGVAGFAFASHAEYKTCEALFQKGIYRDALDTCKQAAVTDKRANYFIARIYERGVEVSIDKNEARVHYAQAAEAGVIDAKLRIGLMYLHGIGGNRNVDMGLKYLEDAADHGDFLAQNELGLIYISDNFRYKDQNRAFHFFQKSAEQGFPIAQYNLAISYENGRGIEKDVYKAAFWFMKSAQGGDKHAQKKLAALYLHGIGVEKNLKEGLKWLTESAMQGLVESQVSLSFIHMYGKFGVTKDAYKAFIWSSIAAESDDMRAVKLNRFAKNELDEENLGKAEIEILTLRQKIAGKLNQLSSDDEYQEFDINKIK